MSTYYLTAELKNKKEKEIIQASCDDEATLAAINVIMNNAYQQQEGAWAKGYIKLTNKAGEIIREMEAK